MRARRLLIPLPLLLLLLVAAASSPGRFDQIRIAGRVVESGTHRPLSAAQVFIEETPQPSIGGLTDADGRYTLLVPRERFPRGEIRITAALIGFTSATKTVRIPAGATEDETQVDFALEAQAIALNDLVVTGTEVRIAPTTFEDVSTRSRAQPARPVEAAPPPPSKTAYPPAAALITRQGARNLPGWYRGRPHGDREQYAHIDENGFQSPVDHPLSTFSIDVDRASYSNVRRFLLRERRLPPTDAVQIEEMVNYFSYHYDLPRGRDPVAVTTELGAAPWAPTHRLLRVGLASRPVETSDMPPANLVFLVDVSGSMGTPDKLPLVQSSLRMLVERLRAQDRVALVVYAGAAGLVLEPTRGDRKPVILDAIDRLRAGGSTAGGAGLRLAYEVARRHFRRSGNNRVILATDGDFNVGESSDAAMIRLIEEKRAQGTYLTVLGFGTGNLQSEKMQQIAQHGNGNYAYVDGLQEAHRVLVWEMGGTLLTVARDVKIQVEFNPTRVQAYRLLGYENRLMAAEDFNDDRKDAGEMGAGHTVTALYEIVPAGTDESSDIPGVDPLRYRRPASVRSDKDHDELAFVKVRYKRPHEAESRLLQRPVRDSDRAVSGDLSFAAAVAGFGMLLRDSAYRGSLCAEDVMALAEDGLGVDPHGDRREFVDLVRAYEELARAYGR